MHSPIYALGGVRVRLPPLSHTADRRFQCLCGTMRFRTTYMGIEDLNLSRESGVGFRRLQLPCLQTSLRQERQGETHSGNMGVW
jgi:hypothetical protein